MTWSASNVSIVGIRTAKNVIILTSTGAIAVLNLVNDLYCAPLLLCLLQSAFCLLLSLTPTHDFIAAKSLLSQSMTKKTQCLFENLHLEIKADIFSRVPIKDLSQCRFVSKDWCQNLRNLVHDPFFVKLHREHNRNLLVLCRASNGHRHSELYLAEHGEDYTSPKVEKVCSNLPLEKFVMIDSCNGLVCLASRNLQEFFCICNPVTGETLELPQCTVGELHPSSVQSGFAFHAITNTYKIVRTCNYTNAVSLYSCTRVDVYTLGSGTSMWRKIQDDLGQVVVGNRGHVSLHGALHWVRFSWTSTYIEAMDVESESFCAIELPPGGMGRFSFQYLSKLRDCLCICYTTTHHASEMIKIWVMKDYGEATSWTVQYCVLPVASNPSGRPLPMPIYGTVRLLRRMSEGFLLLQFENRRGYFQYDLEKHEIKSIVIDGLPSHSDEIDAVAHFESFISPARLDGGSKR